MRRALFPLLMLLALPVWAASTKGPPPGAILRSPNGTLEMSPQVCAGLGNAPAVPSAAYQPGVDAEGRPVAPADLPGSGAGAVGPVIVEIDGNLAGKLKLPTSVTANPILGFVVVRDGQAYFNGQPLNSDQQNALSSACANTGR